MRALPALARGSGRTVALALCLLALGGCVRGCTSKRPPIHLNPNMDDQPKATALQGSDFFADGKAMRDPLEGTVAREDPVAPGALETGREGGAGELVASIPAAAREAFPVPLERRGEERYGIYCAPCHGDRGDGRGMLFHRAQVASGDLRSARLRGVSDGHLFDVMTHGLGLMPSYAAQVPPADRWAIVAFVRELQAASPVTEAEAAGAAAAATSPAGAEAATAAEGGP
jgi:mono/diheme cytochrome c family protein